MEVNNYITTGIDQPNSQVQNIQGFNNQLISSGNISQSISNIQFNTGPISNYTNNFMNSNYQNIDSTGNVLQNVQPINMIPMHESIEPIIDNNSITNQQFLNPIFPEKESPLYETETQEINPPIDEEDDEIIETKTSEPFNYEFPQNNNQLNKPMEAFQYQPLNKEIAFQPQNIDNNLLLYNNQILNTQNIISSNTPLANPVLGAGLKFNNTTPSNNYVLNLNEVKLDFIPANQSNVSMVPFPVPSPQIKKQEIRIIKVPKIQKVIIPKIKKIYVPSPKRIYVNKQSIQTPISEPVRVQLPSSSTVNSEISNQVLQTLSIPTTISSAPSAIQEPIYSQFPVPNPEITTIQYQMPSQTVLTSNVSMPTASTIKTVPSSIQVPFSSATQSLPIHTQPPISEMPASIPYQISTNASASIGNNMMPVQQTIPYTSFSQVIPYTSFSQAIPYNTFSQAIPYNTSSQAQLTQNPIPTNFALPQMASSLNPQNFPVATQLTQMPNMIPQQQISIPQVQYSSRSFDLNNNQFLIGTNYGMNRPTIYNASSYNAKLNGNKRRFGRIAKNMQLPMQYMSRTYNARKL